jgi:predicted PurR-regulated permease PerM
MQKPIFSPSPHWSWTTKLVVTLTFVAVIAFLLVRFQTILGPLLMAFILAYLFYPLAKLPCEYLKLPWRLSVTLIYLLVMVILGGLITWGGLTLFEQSQNLIAFLQNAVVYLPTLLNNLSTFHYSMGPFTIDLAHLDINSIITQVMSTVQGLLGQIGTILGKIATSAAGLIGWLLFILLTSYFMVSETGGAPDRLLNFQLPGYETDFKRMGQELSRIWNAFLRGQLIITVLTILSYTLIFGVERMPYYLGLALLAGLSKFVPYVGPLIAWTTYGTVAFFAGSPPFGISQLAFAGIVVGISIVYDQFFDNMISPRIIAQALSVHPAAVLVAALVAVNMIGLVGVVLAAPVLATLKLFSNYAMRKLFDQDPWEDVDVTQPVKPRTEFYQRMWNTLKSAFRWLKKIQLSRLFHRA